MGKVTNTCVSGPGGQGSTQGGNGSAYRLAEPQDPQQAGLVFASHAPQLKEKEKTLENLLFTFLSFSSFKFSSFGTENT